VKVSNDQEGVSLIEGFSGTDGAWEVSGLPAGRYTVAAFSAEGSGTTTVELRQGEQKRGVRIKLAAHVGVTGRLVDAEDGSPISGMSIYVFPEDHGMKQLWAGVGHGLMVVKTDQAGRFTASRLPAGRILVAVFATGNHWQHYASTSRTVAAKGGRVVDLGVIKLRRRGPSQPTP
jgi:hypothetical protein